MNTNKITLAEKVERIIRGGNYTSDWGAWAEEPFTAESAARGGICKYENGGFLDKKSFFANNEAIIEAAYSLADGDPNADDCPFSMGEIVDAVIEKINEEREERENG